MDEVRLYAEQAAKRVKMARSTWTTYVSRGLPKDNPIPTPDGVDVDRGHARPWWLVATVDSWQDRRPGKGGRPKASAT